LVERAGQPEPGLWPGCDINDRNQLPETRGQDPADNGQEKPPGDQVIRVRSENEGPYQEKHKRSGLVVEPMPLRPAPCSEVERRIGDRGYGSHDQETPVEGPPQHRPMMRLQQTLVDGEYLNSD
jgi:hypothetical protein